MTKVKSIESRDAKVGLLWGAWPFGRVRWRVTINPTSFLLGVALHQETHAEGQAVMVTVYVGPFYLRVWRCSCRGCSQYGPA